MRISTLKCLKEVWDILKNMHEGMTTVKKFNILKLTKDFDNVIVEDDKFYDDFYSKLNV